jgi:hypothetical protein
MTCVESFLESLRRTRPELETGPIRAAYETAARWHEGQRRKNGDPYISHPAAVASIVADLGASRQVICAALLHDLVEDTPYTSSQLRAEFGDDIASIVEGGGHPGSAVLKLADRLHNMRTIRFVTYPKQVAKSRQTLEIHAPLAHRLGFLALQRELEDLALGVLRPAGRRVLSQRSLAFASLLLPARARARWLQEWTGELGSLPTAAKRAAFTLGVVVYSLPRLALSLRRSGRHPGRWITALAGTLTALGALAAIQMPMAVVALAAATAVVGGLILLAFVLFGKSDTAARRLADLIRAWRRP